MNAQISSATAISAILAISAIFAVALFSACSDDKPEPTHADKCAAGLTTECLEGTSWRLSKIDAGSGLGTETAKSGTLKFQVDEGCPGKRGFYLENAQTSDGAAPGSDNYGCWSVEGTQLTAKVEGFFEFTAKATVTNTGTTLTVDATKSAGYATAGFTRFPNSLSALPYPQEIYSFVGEIK
jgi:hypothetical protein